MGNRILKESICSNAQIDRLSPFDEIFFYRLIVNADDFGRMDARPSILRSRLFPLKDIRNSQIESALHNLASVELVSTYIVDGKPFVRLLGWERNQQIRAKKSKYPAPDIKRITKDSNGYHMISNDIKRNHLQSDDIICPRNPIQYEYESEYESEAEAESERAPAREESSAAPEKPDFDTIEAYTANNLAAMNAGNMQEFAAFKDELPEELIRHAIDEACAAGKRTWGYARSIMSRYRDSGFRTIGDVKADAARRACSVNTQKFDYTQRPITPETYGKKSYSDPTKPLEAYDPEVFDPDTYKPENTLRRFYNESELQKLLKTQEGARKEHT